MAVCEIHTGAQTALMKQTSVTVIIPETGTGPYPVLYLLHGLSGNHTVWVRRTSIERYVQNVPMLVVMPDTGRGWYSDSVTVPHAAYETALARDLIAFIDRTFNTVATREGRVIGGQSMGGYGAVKLALKYPHLFRAAFSHSGALLLDDALSVAPEWKDEFRLIFGDGLTGGRDDLWAVAANADRSNLPALRLDCGVGDGFLEINRTFHRHLESLGIPHDYVEHPGMHAWDYWDVHIQESIEFARHELGIGL